MNLCSIEDIRGGDAKENAQTIIDIFKGEKGAKRDIVILNCAAALYVSKIVNSFEEGIELSKKNIDNGKALQKLNQIINLSKELSA
jgi:anthranilate phosphoribosyltransferase